VLLFDPERPLPPLPEDEHADLEAGLGALLEALQ
jgi:hypothetical protein